MISNVYNVRLIYSSHLENTANSKGIPFQIVDTNVSTTPITSNGSASTSVSGSGSKGKGQCIRCNARGDAYYGDILYCAPCALKLHKEGRLK